MSAASCDNARVHRQMVYKGTHVGSSIGLVIESGEVCECESLDVAVAEYFQAFNEIDGIIVCRPGNRKHAMLYAEP